MSEILREIRAAVMLFAAFSVLLGLIYPLVITGMVQVAMPGKAGGSLIYAGGNVVGSELIGQSFSGPGYFHGRPSAVGYSANASGASNYGPTSARLMEDVKLRVAEIRRYEGMPPDQKVPSDLVTASGSGLDPHISVEGAMVQVPRVARARGLSELEVQALVRKHTEQATMGILGQDRVNVLGLNMDLDAQVRR